ncbi:hypothetical protein [Dyella terrae]|uniref:Uncharacterized protein n=1 Tax=Dyella terrae TaxID=522259 RepID=A0ABY1Z0J2_9GAMM|nr:hypothetical protein [Dyella terrae]TBR40622.1 hypothetical protein EYV96_10855 [Dyella terrae]
MSKQHSVTRGFRAAMILVICAMSAAGHAQGLNLGSLKMGAPVPRAILKDGFTQYVPSYDQYQTIHALVGYGQRAAWAEIVASHGIVFNITFKRPAGEYASTCAYFSTVLGPLPPQYVKGSCIWESQFYETAVVVSRSIHRWQTMVAFVWMGPQANMHHFDQTIAPGVRRPDV